MPNATKKLTKKTYEARKASLLACLKATEAGIAALNEGDGNAWHSYNDDHMNIMHDAKYQTEEALKNLESEYCRRNWTTADYQLNELVINNVD